MRNKFFIACVAVIAFILMLCTIIGCNATNESTDRLEKTIKEEESSGDTTIINNYNDNSTTTNNNNTTNNYYNTDTDDTDVEEETDDDDDYVVKVYVTEGRIVNDEESGSEYREYKDYSDINNDNSDYNSDNCDTITPIGDIKNDMDPDPNVVHIKNIKCPNCGNYSYIEHYNLNDEDLLFYMGTCKSCGYERQ